MKHAGIAYLIAGALVAGTLVLAACGGDKGGAAASPGASMPTATPVAEVMMTPQTPAGGVPHFEEPPLTFATVGTETVEMGIGTFCWTMLCVDKIGIVTKGSLSITAGETVSIAIPDGTPPFRDAVVGAIGGLTPQNLEDGSQILPHGGAVEYSLTYEVDEDSIEVLIALAPGRYVLSVFMFFQAGDVVYGLELVVE